MKIKKYTNSAWTDLDKPVKKYDTYTDEATTLPLTIQTSATDAVENYQVYGTSEGAGVETENLWDGNITAAWIDLNGVFNYDPNSSSIIIECNSESEYAIKKFSETNRFRVISYASSPTQAMQGTVLYSDDSVNEAVVSAPANAKYLAVYINSVYSSNEKVTIISGSTAPASYIPYGYKIPILCESRIVSENEFPYAEAGTFALGTGSVVSDGKGSFSIDVSNLSANTYSDYIPLKQNYTIPQSKDTGGEYTFYLGNSRATLGLFIEFLDSDKTHIEEWQCATSWRKSTAYSNMTGSTIAYIRFYVRADFIIQMTMSPMFSKNSNLTSYVPHFQQSNYDLFIGSTKLGAEEYLDYGEQKVYKDISGTLTPTDPPIPLPAIPTYKGENTLSVDTTVQPEKVAVEYEGWKGVGDVEKYQNGEWSDNNGT